MTMSPMNESKSNSSMAGGTSSSSSTTRTDSTVHHSNATSPQYASFAAAAPTTGTRHSRINSQDLKNSTGFDCENNNNLPQRLVVVRYFLDRPGYGLHDAAARLWFHPPPICTPQQVNDFLVAQGIAIDGLLVEVKLDQFDSFMMLQACAASCVEWDFSQTTTRLPGFLNIRLTDLVHAAREEATCQAGGAALAAGAAQQQANTTPVGLFSFSMMVGLETVALLGELLPDNTIVNHDVFVLAWGPYMFFVGGILQLTVGIFQTLRGNLYGATAFLVFGCFWCSNGTIQILQHHFTAVGSKAQEALEESDPWGLFFRSLFVFGFSCVLLKQTFVMNRLSSTLIALLCCKVAAGAFGGWSHVMQWIQLVFGTVTSLFAFYVFTVELTNQVYQREVFQTYKWSEKNSPEESFGALGRHGTLHSKATRLRQASFINPRTVREAFTKRVSFLPQHSKAS